MSRPAIIVVPLLVLVLLACGTTQSSSSSSSGDVDGGADGSPGAVACSSAVSAGETCAGEGACCTVTVPDGFGPEGYRCTRATWTNDSTCLPPPPVCEAPLQGTLTRGDGGVVHVTCSLPLDIVGVVSTAIQLEGSREIELYFDRVPKAGDVVGVIPYKDARALGGRDAGPGDAGSTPNVVGMRVGTPGGFSGFGTDALSLSGSMTVTAIETNPAGAIRALHGTLDAQMEGFTGGWAGRLAGSW